MLFSNSNGVKCIFKVKKVQYGPLPFIFWHNISEAVHAVTNVARTDMTDI